MFQAPNPMYQRTSAPSYASAASSGRGLFAPHLDVSSTAGLTAFRAGPRRDPLSRETHVLALAGSGRSSNVHKSGAVNAYTKNIFNAGVNVGPAGSWENEILTNHSSRQPLTPAVGSMENGGRWDGVLGSGAAGAAHPNLGLFGANPQYGGGGGMGYGPPPPTSPHYGIQTSGFTEEAKRQFLLSNERARRGADQRWARTNTLGAYVPVNESRQPTSPRQPAPWYGHALPAMPQPPATAAADGRGSSKYAFQTPHNPPMPLATPAAPERRVHWSGMM